MEFSTRRVALLTGVEEEMILKVRLLAEASRADLTLKRPRSAVNVHVRAEIAGCRERLGAETAFVWLFLLERNEDRVKHPSTKCCFLSCNARV